VAALLLGGAAASLFALGAGVWGCLAAFMAAVVLTAAPLAARWSQIRCPGCGEDHAIRPWSV
jgi:hypothetical protein